MNLFPNAQIGSERELLEGVQGGDITMMISSTVGHVSFVPDIAIFDMMFVHPDLAAAHRAIDDPEFMETVRRFYRQGGFHLVGFADSGFRLITSVVSPIETVADMSGFLIRSSMNTVHLATWEALGANPTPVAITEVYLALQQGVVDGMDSPIELMYAQRFYEPLRFATRTNHLWQVNGAVMCPVFYDSLPADLQDVVDRAGVAGVARARQFLQEQNDIQVNYMSQNDVAFIDITDAQRADFRELVVPVWGIVEDMVSPEIFSVYLAAADRAQGR
jgi:tripartite ATP-independent transporter DctP family solute receptor